MAKEWQTIACHGLQVGREVERIASGVAPEEAALLHLAGRWHDLGKAHPAFQGSIQANGRPDRHDIAKAPDVAWPCSPKHYYRIDETEQRRGFRHELVSALGLFAVLQRHDAEHQALLGPWRDWFKAIGGDSPASVRADRATSSPTPVEQEILELTADEFDLLVYLVCSHHGKVRMTWHASPADQQANDTKLRIRGVREDDLVPPVTLATAVGDYHHLPASVLDLAPAESGLSFRTGRSWTERVLNLVERFGPFTLAWFEALLRAADQRASRNPVVDPLLRENKEHQGNPALDESRRRLASPLPGGTAAATSGSDSSTGRPVYGDGGRARQRRLASGTTRPPYSSTRYIETTRGILSYQELAPLLGERVAVIEFEISLGAFSDYSLHELPLELHRQACVCLTPEIAGRWRLRNVRVGSHRPAAYWQVPLLMHNYSADLKERLANLGTDTQENHIELLAFAEGQFLHIHPFEDFNGRVSRLLITELLFRLNFPVVDASASSPEDAQFYFSALRAYDQSDSRPLQSIWRRRLAKGAS